MFHFSKRMFVNTSYYKLFILLIYLYVRWFKFFWFVCLKVFSTVLCLKYTWSILEIYFQYIWNILKVCSTLVRVNGNIICIAGWNLTPVYFYLFPKPVPKYFYIIIWPLWTSREWCWLIFKTDILPDNTEVLLLLVIFQNSESDDRNVT